MESKMREKILQNWVNSFQKHSDGEQNERAKLESLLNMERDLSRQMHPGLHKAAEWENALGETLGTRTGMRRQHKGRAQGHGERLR